MVYTFHSLLEYIEYVCYNFNTFVKRHRLLAERLIRQGFGYNKLCISFFNLQRGIMQS